MARGMNAVASPCGELLGDRPGVRRPRTKIQTASKSEAVEEEECERDHQMADTESGDYVIVREAQPARTIEPPEENARMPYAEGS